MTIDDERARALLTVKLTASILALDMSEQTVEKALSARRKPKTFFFIACETIAIQDNLYLIISYLSTNQKHSISLLNVCLTESIQHH